MKAREMSAAVVEGKTSCSGDALISVVKFIIAMET